MHAKLYHNKRPGIWPTIEDYLRLHIAMLSLCTSDSSSSNALTMANGVINGSLCNDNIRIPPEGMEAVEPQLTVA